MKKTFTLLTLSLAMLGSVACSTAPKQEPAQAEASVAAEPPAVEDSKPMETPSTDSNLSLGAGSSGRGH